MRINIQKPNNFKIIYPIGSETNEPIGSRHKFYKTQIKESTKINYEFINHNQIL